MDLGKPYLDIIRVPLSCETFARTMDGSQKCLVPATDCVMMKPVLLTY